MNEVLKRLSDYQDGYLDGVTNAIERMGQKAVWFEHDAGLADGDTEAPEHREHVATQERPYSRAAEDAQARSDAEAIGSLISLDDLALGIAGIPTPEPGTKPTDADTIIAAPGTFEWAVCMMKRGKTVRRKMWPKVLPVTKATLRLDCNKLKDEEGVVVYAHSDDITATDWELAQ